VGLFCFWGFISNLVTALVTAFHLIEADGTLIDRHLTMLWGNLQRLFHAEKISMSRSNADSRF
jgi:hypothetical protein